MPVSRLLDELTYEELLGWYNYFERRPVGWREDDRTHKLLQVQGCKEPGHKIFPSLKAVYARPERMNEDGTNMASLIGSSLFQQMMKAKGGDQIPL